MIKQIQYLRGIAAMLVVWHHALSQIPLDHRFTDLPPFGGYGVDLFFVISGFIMLVTTWDKPITPVEFMKHRIRRVMPLYWLATILMVAVALAAPSAFKSFHWNLGALAKSLFFVPYENLSFPGTISPLLVPGWSLNYEMFFYLIFALTLFLKREWRLPAMGGTLAVLVSVGLLVHPKAAPAVVYTNPVMLEFAAGMILGRLWVMRQHKRSEGQEVLMALGDSSYSIYLTHIFTLGVIRVLWVKLVPYTSLVSSVAWMVFALLTCAVAGWICYQLVERPLLRSKPGSRLVLWHRLRTL